MKIHIIGGSGTGKTYLAKQLAAKYQIPHYDLDELQWDNRAEHYGVKRDKDERDRMLSEILKEDDWIINLFTRSTKKNLYRSNTETFPAKKDGKGKREKRNDKICLPFDKMDKSVLRERYERNSKNAGTI